MSLKTGVQSSAFKENFVRERSGVSQQHVIPEAYKNPVRGSDFNAYIAYKHNQAVVENYSENYSGNCTKFRSR